MIFLFILSGLWLGLYLSHDYVVYTIISIFLVVFIFKKYKKKFCLLFITALAAGFSLSLIKIDNVKDFYKGVVIESKENYFLFSSSFEKFYVYEKANDKEVGDILSISGEKIPLNFSSIESGFDFTNYLNDKGVIYELDNPSIEILLKTPFAFKRTRNNFLSHFSANNKSLVSSLLFGYGEDSIAKDKLSSYHLYRLFNAGGLFVNAFLFLFAYLFKIKLDDNKAKLCSYICLLPYFVISINKFAVFRVFLVQGLLLLNKFLLKKRFNYIEILCISAIGLLIFDYHLAYQDGFILGYLISIIIYFISNSFSFISKKSRAFVTALFVFLFFIPFELEYYHSISLLSPILTIILTPLFITINTFNLLSLYHLPLHGVIDFLLGGVSSFFANININALLINSAPLPLVVGIIYELLLLLCFYYFSIRFRPFSRPLALIVTSLLCLIFIPIKPYLRDQIYFINVGQGDSALIISKGQTALIDTGGSTYQDIAGECLIPFFRKMKIYSIDYLLITHEDFDHNGAKDSLMNNYKVSNVVDREDCFPLKVGNVLINNLNPYAFTNDRGENDSSLVLDFTLAGQKFLLMGDASKDIEKAILSVYPTIDCDILKVGHHGSNTSSGFDFIKTISPREAVISVGENNRYGHPHVDVLDTLRHFGVVIRRTDLEGTICYY